MRGEKDLMQKFVYLIILAIVVLMFKAFFLDEYLEKRANESNTSIEDNSSSVEAVSEELAPVVHSSTNEMNITGMSAGKKSIPVVPEDKKMPLDKLGDSLSKHVNL
jgi:predicted RNA-binding protein with EMAP domain